MRIKVGTILTTIIIIIIIMTVGFLSLPVTPNKAFGISIDMQQTLSNGLSSITQSSTQTITCTSGITASGSCSQFTQNLNSGDVVSSTIASDIAAGLIGLSNIANGLSSITQSSAQTSSINSGASTTNSANQLVINSNQAHTVSSTILSDQIPVVGGTSASAISTSSITQSNTQTSSINSGASTNSANQLVINSNQAHT